MTKRAISKKTIRKQGYSNSFEKKVYDTLLREFNNDKVRVLHNRFLPGQMVNYQRLTSS